MRITKIKLAGFKSFVDPTTLTLPGNLTGVVGPNGCGKSNIIDALQWVMGESSAKQLRGDSMADVIFSGSSSRKPVGQAAVELLFDNADGTIGGQYASFGEISIKRVVTRDGVSNYFLNGTRCRRRDITDVFLGTGLGARGGYSVIEQGMISRVIEAKPEELRGFLEEAAGISKYKERRRETENRMRHTDENLERLTDIREELAKQLTHLQRQAKAAEKYQELKTEERLLEAQVLALRWRAVDAARVDQHKLIIERENAVEASLSELRGVESNQASLRESQTQALDEFNRKQSDFYGKSAEISRLEQAIQHAEERRATLEQDLQRARHNMAEAGKLLEGDTLKLTELEQERVTIEPQLAELASTEDEHAAKLRSIEHEADSWQQAWDQYNTERAETARLEHAEQVRLEHLQTGFASAEKRISALVADQAALDPKPIEDNVSELNQELLVQEQRQEELLVEHEQVKTSLDAARRSVREGAEAIHERRSQLQIATGRLASLKALQEAALGRDQTPFTTWLAANGFAANKVLAEQISIERGWEHAVETALKVPLSALCADHGIAQLLQANRRELPAARLSIIESGPVSAPARTRPDATRLADKVRSQWSLEPLLAGIYVAADLDEAERLRPQLAADESVMTADGVWLGPNWAQVPGGNAPQEGILERERLIDELRLQTDELQAIVASLQQELAAAQQNVQTLEQRDREVAQLLRETSSKLAGIKSQLARRETELEQMRHRMRQTREELQQLTQKMDQDQPVIVATEASIVRMRAALAEYEQRRETLVAQRQALQLRLDSGRTAWRESRETRHQLALKLESLRSTAASLATAISRNTSLQQESAARCGELETALRTAAEPQEQLRLELDRGLQARMGAEAALSAARQVLNELDQRLRMEEERRSKFEREILERQKVLEQVRLEERALQVRLQELEERLQQHAQAPQALLEGLPLDATEESWRERLENVANRIARLGPINLAAIDEFAQLSERKAYLDRQHEDLSQALETLREAIHKIDKETRTRFKETFDKVNVGFQTLFPTLFGGGHAYLELTGEDLLETGVSVMARPPGKRNSTIHLLSGGEKALTALAFVFSLFELNPAPFCLLDEVDAPLDDANVVRLTEMLKTMSERIQFIYVTHNKITMEIAAQLIGVTMQEAGVSRLVSVNMEEAVALAAIA